jgi:iron(III) transport system ATP-binding protein
MILSAHRIGKSYGEQTVLYPLDLQVIAGEKLGIIGETGSGKTTLLRSLAGLVQLDQGSVFFQEERVLGPAEKLLPGHPSIAYLSQSVDLRNQYRVRDLLELNSILDLKDDAVLAKLCRIDHLMDRMTDQLSGGERQRIGLAIALAKKPRVLLLDEPFSNLDIGHRNTLRAILDDMHQDLKLTLLIISHNPTEILGWADRIVVMRAGQCVQTGTSEQIYTKPIDEYVAQLLGPYNLIPNSISNQSRITRPENFWLQQEQETGWNGMIVKKEFEGSSTLYTVLTDLGTIQIRTIDGALSIGQKVSILEKENHTK